MNREQFDVWVTEHYTELLAVARRRTRNADDAEQDVQDAVRRMLTMNPPGPVPAEREDTTRQIFPDKPWSWSLSMLAAVTTDRRASDKNRHEAHEDAKTIFSDQTISLGVAALEPVGRPEGIARWRYQQIRDEALFQKAWLEDERESFVKAMRRRHHFGEPGQSYVQFGQEVTR